MNYKQGCHSIYIVIFLLSMFLTSCAPRLDTMYKVPENIDTESASIIMIRDSTYLETFYPTVDGKTVAGLNNGDYVRFTLPTGRHTFRNMLPVDGHSNTFALILFGGRMAHWAKADLTLTTENNKEYYFLLSANWIAQQPKIELLDEAAGKTLLSASDLVPTGTISGNTNDDITVLDMLLK